MAPPGRREKRVHFMRIFNTDFSKRTVRRLAGPALSLAGLALMTAPSEAQANNGDGESCTSDSQCDDYNWDTENWCHQGSCKTVRRHKQSCKDQPKQDCWSDYACQDGNPNTVNWCEFDGFDWFNWWKPGKCYSAPRDGSGCVGGGEPTQCTRNRDCRDGDRTTRDWCFEGSCFHIDKSDAACLEDGSYCLGNRHCGDGDRNTIDWCYQGECYHAPKDGGGSCKPGQGCDPADCPDDGNDCTQADCVGDSCAQINVDDGTACNNNSGVCSDGVCQVCDPDQCPEDDNPCTFAACLFGACAQSEVDNGTSCGDEKVCQDGLCIDVVCNPANCPNDSNECTVPACDQDGECALNPVDDNTSCDGGNGSCQAGVCQPNFVCDPATCPADGNECTEAACENNACVQANVQNGTSCNNNQGVCQAGACVGCIDDSQCSDANACNGAETCVNNVCQAGTAVECAQVECQAGSCDPNDGSCSYTDLADGSSCSDGAGQCFGGQCTVCQPSDCEDETNECTAARCNETNQCVDEPVTDGTPCTGGQCNSGQCVECVADSDCASATNCTEAATCVNNSCQAGAPVVCPDDGNICTAHSCDPATGCVTSNVADGTSCGTNGETCQAGVCQTPVLCDPIEVTVYATRRGAVNNPTSPFSGNDWKVRGNGYQIRYVNGEAATHSYWCWDLDNIDGTILSAEFSATHSNNTYQSADATETVSLNEMVEPCDSSLDIEFDTSPKPVAFNQRIFNDTGDGPSYGTFTASAASANTTELVTLNAAGIAGIQNAIDNNRPFGMGASLLSSRTGGQERVFKGTTGDNPPKFTKLNLVVRPNTCATTETLQAVDLGHWIRLYQDSTQTDLLTYRYRNPSPDLRPEHQNYPTGRQIQPGGRIGEGRAYFIFDVGGVSDAKAAKLRLWVSQRQPGFNEFGAYNSIDPSETVVLREFSGYTPAQILDTAALPYRDDYNHTNDRPVFDAMGVGELYSDRVFTQSDEETNLIPNPNAPAGTVCNDFLAAIPCGKWVEFPLNDAGLAALNANNGQWMFSMSMVSFSPSNTVGASGWESVMQGTIVDLSPGAGALYPAYKAPEPELVISRF